MSPYGDFCSAHRFLCKLLVMKHCPTCFTAKDESEFGKNKRKKDGFDYQCRSCVNTRMRKAYAENPGPKIAATRKYHQDHPEWSRERMRVHHHQRHREARALGAKLRGLNPVVRAARRAATRRSESRRRAILRGVRADQVTAEDYGRIFAAHEGRCWICKIDLEEAFTHWDHVQPLARGGEHTVANLRPACNLCNIRKNAIWPFTEEEQMRIRTEVQNLRAQVGGDANVDLLR